MKLPVVRTRVVLPSLGLNERRATVHFYSHSEMVTVRTPEGPSTGLGHFYKCLETGELRRYGFDAAFPKDN